MTGTEQTPAWWGEGNSSGGVEGERGGHNSRTVVAIGREVRSRLPTCFRPPAMAKSLWLLGVEADLPNLWDVSWSLEPG